jgi:hypothetical protein
MNIREDVKFGQITFNCVAISNFKHNCDADIMQEEHIKSVVLNEIKKFILEDFAAKLYSLYESYYMSIPYSITTYKIFQNKYGIEETMVKPKNTMINSIDISIEETIIYCEEYFEKMISARFPNGKSLNYNIRSFFGNGEFPIISTLVLIYKDSIYWAYGISR